MRKLTLAASLPASTAILLIAFGTAEARILNVPEDFQTIQAGIDAAEEGDTVLLQPGVYDESPAIRTRYIVLAGTFLFERNRELIANTVIENQDQSLGISCAHVDAGTTVVFGITIRNCSYGVYVLESNAQISYCDFIGNESHIEPGGGISAYGGTIMIDHCRFLNNTGFYWGGGICVSTDLALIESCLFFGNHAGEIMGGIGCIDGLTRLLNCTIVDNYAGEYGGGIVAGAISRVWLKDCIIRGNRPQEICLYSQDEDNPVVNIGYSNIFNGRDSILIINEGVVNWLDGNIDTDPLFLDPDNGDFSLTADSPCIDAGDPDAPLDPDGTRADMGAFYFHQRDIEVEPRELHFPPIAYGAIDSLPVEIKNVGKTTLNILEIWTPEQITAICPSISGWLNPPIEILPDSVWVLWIYHTPLPELLEQGLISVRSDDPDEPGVNIEVTGEVLSASEPQLSAFRFQLFPAFPNPFNATTTIRFSNPGFGETGLRVYGIDGRLVAELHPPLAPPASGGERQTVIWNAEEFPAGVYLIRLESENRSATIKTILMK